METKTTATAYTLIMLNNQGASDQTTHPSKAAVRRQIRTWEARDMTARVFVDADGKTIYEGKALGF